VSLETLARVYGVPAKRGRRIMYDGEGAVIVTASVSGKQLRILVDGETEPKWVHPSWHVDYLDGEGVRQ
jgi:hypothetical protein